MTSQVNPSNINGNYPIAGQDNDSQGFRDNFTNIKNNFYFIKQEVEDLQAKAILSSALTGTTLNNDFLNSQVKNIQTKNLTETVYDWGQQGGATAVNIQLDFALGNVHKLTAQGSIIINSVIKNWPGALQYSRLLLYINIPLTSYTLTLPSGLTTDLTGIPGLRSVNSNNVVTFTDPGNYIFEFSSVNSGTDIFVRELTKGNPEFRDPNFYLAGIGSYSSPSLRVGWGNLIAISSLIDTGLKGNADVLSIRGGITSYMNSNDSGNDPSTVTQGGFSVGKSRASEPGGTYTEAVLAGGDYIGYFNAIGYTGDTGDVYSSYQRLAAIDMYATGIQTSLGGNIVISTKRDGGVMSPAVTIDNAQNMTVYGNLDVKGVTTYLESTIVTIKDKNLIIANGATSTDSASGSGFQIETGVSGGNMTYANLAFYGPSATNTASGRFDFNYPVNVSATTTSTDSGSGALVVKGGVGIAGALNVAGAFGLTSTVDATNTSTAAFALQGGLATVKNIIAGGTIYANSGNNTSSLSSGAFVVQGGAAITGNLFIGGQSLVSNTQTGLQVLSTTTSTGTQTGAVVVAGGLGVSGPVFLSAPASANGVTISSTLSSPGSQLTASNLSARTNPVALRVKGGSIIEGNLVIGAGGSAQDPGSGRLFVDTTAANAAPAFFSGNMGVDFTQGGVIVGNSVSYTGITVAGDLFMGTDNTGTIFTARKSYTLGVPTQPASPGANVAAALTPYAPQNINGVPGLGALTAKGGANLMGDVFVGQPWTGATGTTVGGQFNGYPTGAFSGNLNLVSGTQSRNYSGGALIIANVGLPDGTFSQGGAGIAGNLYVQGGAFLGSMGSTNTYANAVAVATTNSTSPTTGALVVATGGLGVGGNVVIGANVTVNGGPFRPINAVGQTGVMPVTANGVSYTTTSTSLTSPSFSATSTSSTVAQTTTTVTGSIVGTTLTTTAGSPAIGQVLSGAGIVPGTYIVSGSGTSWVVSTAQSVPSTVFSATSTILTVGGTITGYFAPGMLLSGTNVDARTQIIFQITGSTGLAGTYMITPFTGTIASGQAINASYGPIQFTAEANSTYYFEAWVFHDTSVAATKGFAVSWTAGTCNYVVEQQSSLNGSLTTQVSSTTATVQTAATATGVTGMLARISGHWQGSTAATITLQAQVSTGVLTIRGPSYFKWTRLF